MILNVESRKSWHGIIWNIQTGQEQQKRLNWGQKSETSNITNSNLMFGVLMLPVSKANFRNLDTECLKGNHHQYSITTTLLPQNSWILHLCVKAGNSVISFLQTADTYCLSVWVAVDSVCRLMVFMHITFKHQITYSGH